MKLTRAVSLALGVVCTSMAAGVLAETGMTGHQHLAPLVDPAKTAVYRFHSIQGAWR